VRATDPDTQPFECLSCGFVYDPGEGNPQAEHRRRPVPSVPSIRLHSVPGLPQPVGAFRTSPPQSASGFLEEKPQFRLGSTKLTPGQKKRADLRGLAWVSPVFPVPQFPSAETVEPTLLSSCWVCLAGPQLGLSGCVTTAWPHATSPWPAGGTRYQGPARSIWLHRRPAWASLLGSNRLIPGNRGWRRQLARSRSL